MVDAATAAINDAVKALELMTYTANFYVNGQLYKAVTAKVGEQIIAPKDPSVDGYNFNGWDPAVGTMAPRMSDLTLSLLPATPPSSPSLRRPRTTAACISMQSRSRASL